MKTILFSIFFTLLFNFSSAYSKTILNCTQSKIGNLKNKNIKLVINSDLKKSDSEIAVELNDKRLIGKWKNVFDEMLNENVDVIQGEKEISGLIHFFSYGPKRKILGYEIIDQKNKNNSQFGLLGCK